MDDAFVLSSDDEVTISCDFGSRPQATTASSAPADDTNNNRGFVLSSSDSSGDDEETVRSSSRPSATDGHTATRGIGHTDNGGNSDSSDDGDDTLPRQRTHPSSSRTADDVASSSHGGGSIPLIQQNDDGDVHADPIASLRRLDASQVRRVVRRPGRDRLASAENGLVAVPGKLDGRVDVVLLAAENVSRFQRKGGVTFLLGSIICQSPPPSFPFPRRPPPTQTTLELEQVRALSSIRHPNLATILGYLPVSANPDDGLALVIPVYAPTSLAAWIDSPAMLGPYTEELYVERLTVLGQVAKGVAFLHSRGVVHGAMDSTMVLIEARR